MVLPQPNASPWRVQLSGVGDGLASPLRLLRRALPLHSNKRKCRQIISYRLEVRLQFLSEIETRTHPGFVVLKLSGSQQNICMSRLIGLWRLVDAEAALSTSSSNGCRKSINTQDTHVEIGWDAAGLVRDQQCSKLSNLLSCGDRLSKDRQSA
jgi:hypothetical protein